MRREVGWGWRGWGGRGGCLQQQGQPQGHLGERAKGTWPNKGEIHVGLKELLLFIDNMDRAKRTWANQGEILAEVVATVSIDNMKSLTMKTFIQKFLDVVCFNTINYGND